MSEDQIKQLKERKSYLEMCLSRKAPEEGRARLTHEIDWINDEIARLKTDS